jgi:hypothetical protein
VRVDKIRFGGCDLPAAWMQVQPQMEKVAGEASSGTVGLDLFIGHVIIIDFPGRRIFVFPHADTPGWLWDRTAWVPAELRYGKFFPMVKINGTELDGVFLDTGSSESPLQVDFETWKRLTGRAGEADATKRFSGNSWGKTLTFIGAPVSDSMDIGDVKIANPIVYYCRDDPESFRKTGIKAVGLMGNATIWDSVVVIDLGISPQFGIVR